MANKYLDSNGLLYFWQKIKALFVTDVTYSSSTKKIQKTKNGSTSDVVTLSTVATSGSYNDLSNKPTIPSGVEKTTTTPKMDGTAAIGSETKFAAGDHVHPSDTTKVDKVSGKGLSTNDYTTTEKNKLSGIASGAEVNQNAFSNVKVGSTTVAADAKTDTLELVAGSHVTLTPDATNDKITIDAAYSAATVSEDGLMTGSMYASLDNSLYFHAGLSSGNVLTLATNSGDDSCDVLKSVAIGAANGVCPLNASSKIDASYLPSYVDDVIEAYPRSGQTELSATWFSTSSGGSALTPETGKIYILMVEQPNYPIYSQFRWSGTTYIKMNDGGISAITNSEIDTIVAS